MKTRVVEYEGFYIPQYQTSILCVIKFWTDYTILRGPIAFSCMFETKEGAENFLSKL
jgi:hypothetical protein